MSLPALHIPPDHDQHIQPQLVLIGEAEEPVGVNHFEVGDAGAVVAGGFELGLDLGVNINEF